MWSQDYLAAPWTTEDLFTQLHTNLTNPLAGWTLYEDERLAATYPYVIYRNNLGIGRDMLLWIDITNSSTTPSNRTIRTFAFEHAAYTAGSGVLPSEILYLTGVDLETGTNLLINHGNSPNKKNMLFWFEQGVRVSAPASIFSIEPYVLPDGVTLMNTGDDGTSYPLWTSLDMYWNTNTRIGTAISNRSNASFSYYFGWERVYSERPMPYVLMSKAIAYNSNTTAGNYSIESLFFKAPRSPVPQSYTLTTRTSIFGVSTSSVVIANIPVKRIDVWSGGAAFVEGYRPEIISGEFVGTNLHVDPRGYLGEPGDLLIARTFGGALTDSFSVDGNAYRIVHSVNQGTAVGDLQLEIAMRVS